MGEAANVCCALKRAPKRGSPSRPTNACGSLLKFSGLTANIVAVGVAGAPLTSIRPKAPDGSDFILVGLNGTDGANAGHVTIQLVGPGPTFLIDATNGVGINAQSIGGAGGDGGTGFAGWEIIVVPFFR